MVRDHGGCREETIATEEWWDDAKEVEDDRAEEEEDIGEWWWRPKGNEEEEVKTKDVEWLYWSMCVYYMTKFIFFLLRYW